MPASPLWLREQWRDAVAARRAEHPWNATLAVEALVQRLQRALQPTRPAARAA